MHSQHVSLPISRQALGGAQPPTRSPALHQYACIRCRLRKVKCNKVLSGCAHCLEAATQCTYSARRPRKVHKTHQEIVTQRPLLPAAKGVNVASNERRDGSVSDPSDETRSDDDEEDDLVIPREIRDSSFETRSGSMEPGKGRLFVAQGKSRYINSDKANQVTITPKSLALKRIWLTWIGGIS